MGKRHRLRRSREVAHVRQQGESRRHPLAILLFVENGRPESRFAISASARLGKAHRRNRAKRMLRESLWRHLDEIRPGWDCLLIARAQTATATFADVEKAVMTLLGHAGLLASASRAATSLDVAGNGAPDRRPETP